MATSNGAAPPSGDSQKMGLLSAMAQAGAAGAAAQQQGSQANMQAGQAAAGAALAEPGSMPGTDFGTSLAQKAAAPNIAAAEGIGRQEQAQSIYNQGMNTGAGSYYDALHQASGVANAAIARDVGAMNDRAANTLASKRANTPTPRDIVTTDENGNPVHKTLNMTDAEYNNYVLDTGKTNRDKKLAGGVDALSPASKMVHGAFQQHWDPSSNAMVDASMEGAKDINAAISNAYVNEQKENAAIAKANSIQGAPVPPKHDWAAIRNALKQIYSGVADRTQMPPGSLEQEEGDRQAAARAAGARTQKANEHPTISASESRRVYGGGAGLVRDIKAAPGKLWGAISSPSEWGRS